MSVAAEPPHSGLTWEAFIELPDELLKHAELLDGEVHELASPGRPHQLTLVNLILALNPWVHAHGGEIVPDIHVKIAARRGYQPDLAWYEPARVPASGNYSAAPNFVVEILSPSTRRNDGLRKPTDYFAVGVQEMWLVDVDERMIIGLRPTSLSSEWRDGDTITTPVLPGLEIAATDLIPQVS